MYDFNGNLVEDTRLKEQLTEEQARHFDGGIDYILSGGNEFEPQKEGFKRLFGLLERGYFLRSIMYYNWDDKPRWFLLYVEECRTGNYFELSAEVSWNGDMPYPHNVQHPGHGIPCVSTEIYREVD